MRNAYERSKQLHINEIIKCGKDPVHFIENYCKVQHPTKGTIPFKMYDFQKDCVEQFLEHRFNIILKSRQLGISTISAAYAVWLALFYRDKNVLVIATKLSTAVNFIKKVKKMIESLPPWLMLGTFESNRQEVRFSNGSIIQASTTSSNAGRSEALSLLIVDEAAFISNFEELWTSIYPTLSCVVADTLVLGPDGFHRIDEYFPENAVDGRLAGVRGKIFGKNGIEDISNTFVSAESPTRRLLTRKGFELEATLEHPVFVLRENEVGMVPIKDLKAGDHVRVSVGMKCFGERNSINHSSHQIIDENLAYMLGGYIAEGWMNGRDGIQYAIWISNSDPEFREVYLNNKIVKEFHEVKDSIKMLCCSKELCEIFMAAGVIPEQKCDTKTVPKAILNCSQKLQASFLRGYFDGDGCGSGGISVSSTSKRLLQEIQMMLLNFGIISGLVKNDMAKGYECIGKRCIGSNKKPIQSVRQNWSLKIPRSYWKKFLNEIGFRISRKRNNVEKSLSKLNATDDTSKQFVVPTNFVRSVILDAHKKIHINDYQLRISHGVRFDRILEDGKICQTTIAKICESFQNVLNNRDKDFLKEVSGDGSYFWDEIVAFENGFAKTYDFTVPGTHSFLQNCILGSNTGGNAIILSTPNGVGGLYYDLYTAAEAKKNDFNPIKLSWDLHPERNQEWFEEQSRQLGSRKRVLQELLCQFIGSGDTFIQNEEMLWLTSLKTEPTKDPSNKDVWIWRTPIQGHRYVMSADVATGNSKDFSAFHIIDVDSCEVAVEYCGKRTPDKLAELMDEWGRRYNNALACPEQNSYGYMTCSHLKTKKYPKLFYMKAPKGRFDSFVASEEDIPGFKTDLNSRRIALSKLETLIRRRKLRTYSSRLMTEFDTFVWEGEKARPMRGKHDDLIMSLAIGAYVMDSVYGENSGDFVGDAALLSYISKSSRPLKESDGAQIDFSESKNNERRPPILTSGYRRANAPAPELIDFSWLIK